MKNILIVNAEAGGNKGAEAMLEILIIKLLEKYSDVSIFLEVSSKQEYYKKVFLKKFPEGKLSMIFFSAKSIFNPYSRTLKDMDLVIDIAGISFHGDSVRGVLRNCARYLPIIRSKAKLYFFTQDFGPSENKIVISIGKHILSKAEVIFTRSQVSYNYLVDKLKLKENKVMGPNPDSTIIFRPKDQYKNLPIGDEKFVVLTPSAIMYVKHGEDYLTLFKKVYDKVASNFKVIILVHNFTPNASSSDTEVCKRLHESCSGSFLINENISTSVLKSILSKAEFSISSRYHVVVGSISKNVPSIAIGWNPKYESFLSLYEKKDWNIDFSESSLQEIESLITSPSFRDSVKELDAANKRLRKQVEDSFEQLFNKFE